jgi:hypothetical protein
MEQTSLVTVDQMEQLQLQRLVEQFLIPTNGTLDQEQYRLFLVKLQT